VSHVLLHMVLQCLVKAVKLYNIVFSTMLLDVEDPLFVKLGHAFLDEVKLTFVQFVCVFMC